MSDATTVRPPRVRGALAGVLAAAAGVLAAEGATAGEGDMLMVNGANVICGGVQTENATVYLIDQVLEPTG